MGPAAAASRVTGPVGPGGEKTETSLGSTIIPGTYATSLETGAAEARQHAGQFSGQQFAADQAEAANFRRSAYPLEQAISSAEKLGPQGTGPGTETLNNTKSFLLSLGVPGIDADKIKNFDEAKKYFTDFVNQNGNSSSNDKLAAAFAGNPSVNISNAAALDVGKAALAWKAAKFAQVRAFQESGLPPEKYQEWVTNNWTNKQDDVRAFGFGHMSPAAQKSLTDSLKGRERLKFLASLKAAHKYDLINPTTQATDGQ
jgi:hypothetical protein